MKKYLAVVLSIFMAMGLYSISYAQNFPGASGNPSSLSRPAGTFYAPAFFWQGRVISGNSATGVGTIIIAGSTGGAGGLQMADGTTVALQTVFSVLTPVTVDWGQGAAETVTPTAVSVGTCPAGNIGVGGSVQCASITATFANTHGQSAVVTDGTYGLQTAINYANALGGGMVSIDTVWRQMGGTNAMLTAAIPFANVAVYDQRLEAPQYWPIQGGATITTAPAVLTAATAGFGVNGANFTGGFYTGSNTYITCITYVDIAGQESPCSATFTISTSGVATTDQIGYTIPAAATGQVGYKIYITLNGGSYISAYNVPLVAQPTVVGVYPVSNGVCTLTVVETITPACALPNTTYNQAGSGAVVSALTLNTSQIEPELTTASSTTIYVPNPGGRTAYTYTPGSHLGTPGTVAGSQPFTITTAAATVTPNVLGTINIAPGFMNYVGRTLEVCGYATNASTSTDTIEAIQFQWDANGQNTAGKGVVIGYENMTATGILTMSFCQDFITTATGATATGGSINTAGGTLSGSAAALGVSGAGTNTLIGTTALLNLADAARLNVIYLHTTGTDGAGLILQALTVKVVN